MASGRTHSTHRVRRQRSGFHGAGHSDKADHSSIDVFKNARALDEHGIAERPDGIYGGTSHYTLKDDRGNLHYVTLKSGLTKPEVQRYIDFMDRKLTPEQVEDLMSGGRTKLTEETAKKMRYGQFVYGTYNGHTERWKVTGKLVKQKNWPFLWNIPIKSDKGEKGSLNEQNLGYFSK